MSCENCKTAPATPYRRKYSEDAKKMGRAMYELLNRGPVDKSAVVITAQEARDACSYCRTLVERDIRLLVYSYDPECDPENATDVAPYEQVAFQQEGDLDD